MHTLPSKASGCDARQALCSSSEFTSPVSVRPPLPTPCVEQHIHSMGISHADMSLENALIDAERENAFLIDFGMSVGMPRDGNGRR